MAVLFTNNATTTLSAPISSTTQTSITVASGTGSLFPAITSPDFFYATLSNSSNQLEIVKVTARSSDTFTIVRGQEGTTARTYAAGDKIELRVTAAALDNKLDKDGGTMTGPLVLPAATTLIPSARLPHGTAPTAPTNGDVWSTTAGFFGRVNGVNITFSYNTLTETFSNKTIDTANSNVLKVNGNTLAATAGTATITLPNVTATLATLAGTETFTNKTLTSPTINGGTSAGVTINASSTMAASSIHADNTITDTNTIAANSPGFRGVPLNSQTAAYTLVLSDQGKSISITTGGVTIPANSSVAFPIGATIVVYNDSASSQNISITTDTLRLAGTATTGTRSLLQRGVATLVKVKSTEWVASGNIT